MSAFCSTPAIFYHRRAYRSVERKRRYVPLLRKYALRARMEGDSVDKEKDSHESNDDAKDDGEEVPLELVDGLLENARVRPKIDIDANESMMMLKLRRMLHEDDFNRIFDKRDSRIGEL